MKQPCCQLQFGLALIIILCSASAYGQEKKEPEKSQENFTITITGDIDSDMAVIAGKMTTLFYECYPKLVENYENPKKPAPRHIHVIFKNRMRVPAYCQRDRISVSVEWLKRNPNDIGMLTHELTHAVQAYPRFEPGWFTEGFADYARKLYGPKVQPGWALPERLTARNSYKDSYRVTGRFFIWMDEKHPGVVTKLHQRLQNREFTIDDFRKLTGSSIDDLWNACVKDLSQRRQ